MPGLHQAATSGEQSQGGTTPRFELRLALDSQSYVIAFRPDNSLSGDGVQGNVKALSPAALKESNSKSIAAASQYVGYRLPFLASIPPDYNLSDLYPAPVHWWLKPASPKPPMEATYANYQEYGVVVMDVYPVEDFPELELGGPLACGSVDSGYIVNSTLARALMPPDYYYRPSGETLQVRNGTDIAGDYAILIAPAESKNGDYPGAGALIWGTSAEG